MIRGQRIYSLIAQTYRAQHLDVVDESHLHAVPAGAQTHFKIIMVCDVFLGRTRVQRQQDLMSLLKAEFQTGLHALSLQLLTPEEWDKQKGQVISSPECIKK